MLDVSYDHGVHLPAEGVWLDPGRSKKLAFVSHAHSDHVGRHTATIATPLTLELMKVRMGRLTAGLHALPFGETRMWENFSMRLLPAGHVLGSAQCLVGSEAGTLLYSGDFKLRPGASAEAPEICRAETLIMETTFGLPRYVFPPAAEVAADILRFCQAALEDRAVPVLLAYSLGKAQEVLSILSSGGMKTMIHKSIAALLPVYRSAGIHFSGCLEWNITEACDCVVLCPPNTAGLTGPLTRKRTAVITGWALDSSAKYRMKCDAAFPLSDHAGYDDLLTYVENVSPRRVFTVHGFATEFARDLRRRGVEAWTLKGADQLDLPLGA